MKKRPTKWSWKGIHVEVCDVVGHAPTFWIFSQKKLCGLRDISCNNLFSILRAACYCYSLAVYRLLVEMGIL